ncbi:MBL fold metallo-hydrolase [Nocardioides sp. ChNu-153]|uniref:MBL fold metallo-hydrolase n=1 Tax=unclassified Nocardioides TaxID=2615069 RepID=UPI002405E3F6|nr:MULTISPECIES: MBL fold metallo-hydrolase [unclassified Nocardioides]MDF9715234.1 MBL fold metallo-hydrolase [Nocardioides sp. ChNu-99]MDN7122555.1 MBL fold metallo-hydrolase [Nocardioides sp. ChNu-153]
MTYTGHVVPGGEPAVRELPGLVVTKVAVDATMANNAYLLRCRSTGAQLLVDAADDARVLLRLVGEGGLEAVVTTHQHWDHHRALAEVVSATGAPTLVGAPDAAAVTEQTGVPVTRALEHGDRVRFGDVELGVIALAGHTPGSVALTYDDGSGAPHLWTGDSLFPGGVGNTFGDEAAFAQLIDEVETKVFGTLPDSTWFYPGHGDDSTLGAERPHLAEWRERGW